MSYKLSLPFHAFQLHIGDQVFSVPMTDQQSLRVDTSLDHLMGKYGESLHRKIVKQGQLDLIMDEIREGEYTQDQIEVSFPKAKDNMSYPPFILVFDFYHQLVPGGISAIIPVLGLEGFGHDLANLKKSLVETVKLDFARKRKLNAVQHILSTMWFDKTELESGNLELEVPSLRDLNEQSNDLNESILDRVATHLQIRKKVLYGFEKELEQLAQALQGKFNRNVLVVGAHGVGKTTLVWQLAHQRRRKKLKGKLWETTASTMIKELMGDTGWQDNLSKLCAEMVSSEDFLYIRNLMELFEVGKSEGNQVSMAQYLRTPISRGELNIIAECTEEEMANIELKSPNYLSFFQVIRLQAPEDEALEKIIVQKVKDIAANKRVLIDEEAIREVIRLNLRFNPYSGMPGKPIHFLESILINKKHSADSSSKAGIRISKKEVIKYFCEDSGMPLFMVDPSLPMDTEQIRQDFNKKIYGQEQAVNGLVEILAAVKTALARKGQPIASLLFVGPTGVGKTELAKVLANFMFGNKGNLVRFDMSEYSNYYATLRLIGQDYFTEGLLTSAVRKSPFCVLLFDEIEKAHPTFFDLLLQVLSEGRLSDNQGKTVNFCSTIIIMTSNIGAEKLQRGSIGWAQDEADPAALYINAIENYFRPELFNRIDRVIPFGMLTQKIVRHVVEREIELFKQREGIKYRRMDLFIDDKVLKYLAKEGYHPKYGARQLQRCILDQLVIPLSRQLNQQDYDEQIIVNVGMRKDKIHFKIELDPLGLDLLIEELEKDSYADYASKLRLDINLFKEGHYFIQVQNELERLTQAKEKEKQAFWSKVQDVKKFHSFSQIVHEVHSLEQTIQEYEFELSLASLNLSPYQPSKVDDLKEFEQSFFQAKKEIYGLLNPKQNTCHFNIYGGHPMAIFKFYHVLFTLNNFQLDIKSVWFRESYYNEEIWMEQNNQKVRKKRCGYIKLDYLPEEDLASPIPEKAGDQLYGFEIAVSGASAYLYLEGELGAQKWIPRPGEENIYLVSAHQKATNTPDKIHRQDHYRKANIRRTVSPSHIKDNILRLDREYHKGELVKLLKDRLDADFKISLNAEMM